MDNSPVLIIGAGRSGTKMLRDALAASSDFAAFNYDANYIWKYGNYKVPDDELTPGHLSPKIEKFIIKQFDNISRKNGGARVIEKSVSNSLRVDFVRAVFPNCKIVHIFRDGRDVAASAMRCWQASMVSGKQQSKKALMIKLLEFPYMAAWPYLLNHLGLYMERFFRRGEHVRSWGPRFRGIDDYLKSHSLAETCAMQWAKSVGATTNQLAGLEKDVDYIDVRYEDLVTEPLKEVQRIAAFLQVRDRGPIIKYAQDRIVPGYIGSWRQSLSKESISDIMPIVKKYITRLGYKELK